MTATPEDLVECWHLTVANGDEPVSWTMSEDLWRQVRRAADERAVIDAGDRLSEVGELTLLGTPVEIDIGSVPLLTFRRDGQLFGTPILGETSGPSAAQRRSHSTFPSRAG